MTKNSYLVPITCFVLLFSLAGSLEAWGKKKGPETFLTSDDYSDGDEIVGTLLTDAEYGRMVEDIEFRDIEFSWGWYKAEYKKPRKPTRLLFEIGDCAQIHIPAVSNDSNALAVGIEDDVREAFVQAMTRLRLEVVEEGQASSAGCRLDIAIVDFKADGTFFYFGTADPFIELEIRLTDLRADEPLMLIRDQEHGNTPAAAAVDVASELMQILR